MNKIKSTYLPKKNTISSEYQECKTWFEYAQHIPTLKKLLIKIPNEGKRESWYGSSLLKIGLRPGLPDYYIPIENKSWKGLWIEMKRSDQIKRKKNPIQEIWIEKLISIGHYATYAYGALNAIKIYEDYVNDRI